MKRALHKKGKTYYVRIFTGGDDKWISTHQTSLKKAEEVAVDILRLFERGGISHQIAEEVVEVARRLARKRISEADAVGQLATLERYAEEQVMAEFVDKHFPAPAVTAAELVKRYQESRPRIEVSTLHSRLLRAGKFARWSGNADMRRFGKADALRFLNSLKTTSANTWKNYISDLAAVWSIAPELSSPWGLDLRKTATRTLEASKTKKALDINQMRVIKTYIEQKQAADPAHADKWRFWHFFVIFSYYTFVRLTDAVHASAFGIRPDGYYEFVPRKTAHSTRGKRVSVFIAPQLRRELDTLSHDAKTGYFFPKYAERYDASVNGRSSIDDEFLDILHAVGLDGYGAHSMRHGGITLAIDEGNTSAEVAAVAGHAIALTEGTYYHGSKKSQLDGREEL